MPGGVIPVRLDVPLVDEAGHDVFVIPHSLAGFQVVIEHEGQQLTKHYEQVLVAIGRSGSFRRLGVPGWVRIQATSSFRSSVTKNIRSESERRAMDRMEMRGFPDGV